MSAFHAATFLFPGECVTTTRKPASNILVLMDSPSPPMPPVINAILFGTIVIITPPLSMRSDTAFCNLTGGLWHQIDACHKHARSAPTRLTNSSFTLSPAFPSPGSHPRASAGPLLLPTNSPAPNHTNNLAYSTVAGLPFSGVASPRERGAPAPPYEFAGSEPYE